MPPLDVVLAAPDDEHVLDGGVAGGECGIHGGLEREDLALAPAAVGGYDDLGLGVVDAAAQALGAETAEHDRVHGAEPRDREHRDDRLRDHGEVDRDPVALADAERRERVRGALDLGGQFGVADRTGVARLALPMDGDAVAIAGEHVPVEAVVCDVELAVGEPARERRVRPVQHLREGRVPVHVIPRDVGPEPEPVGLRGLVEGGRGDRGGGELRRRWEVAGLGVQAVDRIGGHRKFLVGLMR